MIIAGLKNECNKILWRRKYQILIVFVGVFCAIFGILSVNGITVGSFSLTLPNVMFLALSPINSVILPLIIFVLASDLYTHELENKSIKCSVTRPVSRFAVYLSKFLAIACYTALLLAVSYVVTGAFQLISGGGIIMLLEAALAYLVSLAPLMGFMAIAALVAVVIPNPSMTMFLSIIVYVLMLAAGLLWSVVGSALFTSYLGWYKMWVGSTVQLDRIIVTSLLILSFTTAIFACGYLLFDRKEI